MGHTSPPEVTEKLGRNFVRALDSAGLRAADLVRDLRVTHQTVQNWKRRGVSAQWAARVGDLLGVSPASISMQLPVGATVRESQADYVAGDTIAAEGPLGRLMAELRLSRRDVRLVEELIERLAER
jgi:plasmid maintenance system antidote protein VapI